MAAKQFSVSELQKHLAKPVVQRAPDPIQKEKKKPVQKKQQDKKKATPPATPSPRKPEPPKPRKGSWRDDSVDDLWVAKPAGQLPTKKEKEVKREKEKVISSGSNVFAGFSSQVVVKKSKDGSKVVQAQKGTTNAKTNTNPTVNRPKTSSSDKPARKRSTSLDPKPKKEPKEKKEKKEQEVKAKKIIPGNLPSTPLLKALNLSKIREATTPTFQKPAPVTPRKIKLDSSTAFGDKPKHQQKTKEDEEGHYLLSAVADASRGDLTSDMDRLLAAQRKREKESDREKMRIAEEKRIKMKKEREKEGKGDSKVAKSRATTTTSKSPSKPSLSSRDREIRSGSSRRGDLLPPTRKANVDSRYGPFDSARAGRDRMASSASSRRKNQSLSPVRRPKPPPVGLKRRIPTEYDRRLPPTKRKRVYYEEDDEEEDDGFIVSDDDDYRSRRYVYADDYSDCSDMESNFQDIEREERISSRIARQQDREELEKELRERQQKMARKQKAIR